MITSFVTAGLAAACSCLLQAATVTGTPLSTRPVAGQFAIQDHDLLHGDTIAYRPWFDPGSWQGDIIEYFVNASGTLDTDVVVGASPALPGSAGGCGRATAGCWSARASFRINGADDPHGDYWQRRNIFTNNNGQMDFIWDRLNASQQHQLDNATATLPPAQQDAYASDVLNYIRGQRLHEQQHQAITGSTGTLRNRAGILGDITGTPVYIGAPREQLGHVAGFTAFSTQHASRPGRVAVGANDGMLHVFDAADGSEVYAYVPSMLLGALGQLTGHPNPYQHRYYVAGGLTVASVQTANMSWRTLLAGGGGAGFAGLFALDMSDPAFTRDKLLFEMSGGVWGHVYGRPHVGRVDSHTGNPRWALFSGNGLLDSPAHPTALMMIDLDTHTLTSITLAGVTGGLSAPVLLSTDGDDTVEWVFAGDMDGNLWMFDIDPLHPGNSMATRIYQGDPAQPVTLAPVVAKHPDEPGYLVYFASGNIAQTIHAVWINPADRQSFQSAQPRTASNLLTRTLTKVTQGPVSVRVTPDNSPVIYRCPSGARQCPALHRGWKMPLPGCGERVSGTLTVRAGRLQFVTTNLPGPGCATGNPAVGNWLISLDYVHGNDNNKVVYDLDGNGMMDNRDTVPLSGTNKPPVGLDLGTGQFAPPLFVRLQNGIDQAFINRVLPLDTVSLTPGPAPANGPIDDQRPPNNTAKPGPAVTGSANPVLLPIRLETRGPAHIPGRRSWIDLRE